MGSFNHTHNAIIIDRADFDRTVDLVVAIVEKLDRTTVTRISSFEP